MQMRARALAFRQCHQWDAPLYAIVTLTVLIARGNFTANKMKIAIYARVSTDETRQNINNQLQPLKARAATLGDDSPRIFIDYASGSAKGKRVQLDLMFKECHQGKIQCVLVWSLDRFTREGPVKLGGYIESFKRTNVRLISHQETWLDTDSPVTDLLISVLAWVAKFERDRLIERTKAGIARAKREGRTSGPKPNTKNDIRIAIMRSQGISYRKIASELGMSLGAVQGAIKRKV